MSTGDCSSLCRSSSLGRYRGFFLLLLCLLSSTDFDSNHNGQIQSSHAPFTIFVRGDDELFNITSFLIDAPCGLWPNQYYPFTIQPNTTLNESVTLTLSSDTPGVVITPNPIHFNETIDHAITMIKSATLPFTINFTLSDNETFITPDPITIQQPSQCQNNAGQLRGGNRSGHRR